MKFEKNPKYNTNALLVLCIVAFATVIIALFLNLSAVSLALGKLLSVLAPIIYAFLLVLVLMPAVDFFDAKFEKLLKKKNYRKKAKVISVVCTYVLLLAIVSLAVSILVSQFSKAYLFVAKFADEYFPILNGLISDFSGKDGIIGDYLSTFAKTLKDVANNWVKSVPDVAKAVASALGGFVSSISDWVIAVIISVYALFRREKLKSLAHRINVALFDEKVGQRTSLVFGGLYKNLGSFFSARAYNMIVLAVVFYLIFLVMGIEFYSVIALTIAICSFVPIVGLLIGGGVGTLVVLVTETDKTLLYLLVFLVVAFLDYVYLRPLITHKRVRVSFGTTIVCVLVGFFLGRVLGALFALPVYVTLRDLLGGWVSKKKSVETVSNKAE